MFYQIKQTSEALRKIKGSKFIARVFNVKSRESALAIVSDIEEEHRKANHVCWACRIDQNGESLGYSSDAGEPHGSAGPPILAAIEGRDLINVLCVVVRYFGGTKLGIGGLIRAYGGVAAEALDMAGKTRHESIHQLLITAKSDVYSDILRILRKYRLSIQTDFSPEIIKIKFEISEDRIESLQNEMMAIASVKITRGGK